MALKLLFAWMQECLHEAGKGRAREEEDLARTPIEQELYRARTPLRERKHSFTMKDKRKHSRWECAP